MGRKTIRCTYWFQSSSGSGLHETLEYEDGSLSCGCAGWTRRVDSNGNRSCKHTRLIEAGWGPQHAVRFDGIAMGTPEQLRKSTTPAKASASSLMPKPGQRKIII